MKYKNSLDKEFLACGMAIRTLRLEEKEHRRTSKDDVIKFRSWHNVELFRSFRLFMVAKLLRIREEINYHDAKSMIINQSIKVSKFYFSKKKLKCKIYLCVNNLSKLIDLF